MVKIDMKRILKCFFCFLTLIVSPTSFSKSLGLSIDGENIFDDQIPGAGNQGINANQELVALNIWVDDPGWRDIDGDFIHDDCDNDPNDSGEDGRFNVCSGVDENEASKNIDPTGSCKLVTYPESVINRNNFDNVCGEGWSLYGWSERGNHNTKSRCQDLIPRGTIKTSGKKTFRIQFTNRHDGGSWVTARRYDFGHKWTMASVGSLIQNSHHSLYNNFRSEGSLSDSAANVCYKN